MVEKSEESESIIFGPSEAYPESLEIGDTHAATYDPEFKVIDNNSIEVGTGYIIGLTVICNVKKCKFCNDGRCRYNGRRFSIKEKEKKCVRYSEMPLLKRIIYGTEIG